MDDTTKLVLIVGGAVIVGVIAERVRVKLALARIRASVDDDIAANPNLY